MDWPAQSPDLNPIENIWAYIKYKLCRAKMTSLEMLKEEIHRIWNNLPSRFFTNMAKSMNKKCRQVIEKKGGWIKH